MGEVPRAAPVSSPRRSLLRRLALVPPVAIVLVLGLGFAVTRGLANRAEARHPRSGRIVEVAGLQQHVLERGEGAPVVFVHGAYGALQDFEHTILEAAAARHACVLWDRPGHGYSQRPAGDVDPGVQAELLLELVDTLALERPLLVGFSYGGAVCLAAGLRAPERLAGIVLVNGPSHPWPDPLDLEYRVAGVPVLGSLLSETLVAPLGHLLGGASVEQAFAPEPVPDAFGTSPLGLALRPSSYRANTADIRLLKPFLREQARAYARLSLPVHALVSSGDTVVSPTIHVPALAEVAPDVRVIPVEGAGHQLLYTHAELVLETIERALAP